MTERARLLICFAVLMLWVLFFSTCFSAPEPTPSNAALRATIEHIQRLSKDQQANLEKEKQGHQEADASLETSVITLSRATTQIIDLQKQVQAQTDKLNSTQDKLDKAAKALWWYRVHFFLGWIILGTGIAACIFFAFLKLTGRLAILGTAIAAKVP